MSRNHFILYIWLILVVGGCIKEESFSLPMETAEDVYMQVYIDSSKELHTRTTGSETVEGTEGENKISDISIYWMKKSESGEMSHAGTIERTTITNGVSELIRVPSGITLDEEYLLFVVANTGHIGFHPNTATIKAFRGQHSVAHTPYLFEQNNMMMANQHDELESESINKGGVPVTITAEHTKKNPATASIALDRLAVKIVPKVSEDLISNSEIIGQKIITQKEIKDEDKEPHKISKVSIESVGLLNAVNQFNLIQQWQKQIKGNGNEVVILDSPSNKISYSDYYNTIERYYESYSIKSDAPFVAIDKNQITTPFYCLENNSPFYTKNEYTKYKGRTTAIVFKVSTEMQNHKGGNQGKVTFYGFNGKYYESYDGLKKAYETLYNNKNFPARGSSAATFRAHNPDYPNTIKVYENGYMYYMYWIQDMNYPDLIYAVVRNTLYNLTVARIAAVGHDVPGGEDYDPEDPIDGPVEIEIEAVCQPWSEVDEVEHGFN